jgi:hypothetical protein
MTVGTLAVPLQSVGSADKGGCLQWAVPFRSYR